MEYEFEIDHAQPCECKKCKRWYAKQKLMRTIVNEQDKVRIMQGAYSPNAQASIGTHYKR